MPSIHDYLNWRGDVPATCDNINEVDNMIFCLLAYVNFEKIYEHLSPDTPLTLREAAKEYFFSHDEKEHRPLGLIVPTDILSLFRRLADTPRFRGVTMFGYVNEICHEREMQFSAVTFRLEDGSLFVAYRGTDDSIVGWKEDFNLSYMDEVPAQSKATAYLNSLSADLSTALFVGGHSKGGNLAVWGATHARPDVQKRIRRVYCNDGPGFTGDMLSSEAYRGVADRVIFLVPQSSLVGLLLGNDGRYEIVKSRNVGVFQHDGLSWEVMGASFVRSEGLTGRGIRTDTVVRERIEGMSREEKQALVEMFFELLMSTGAETLSELVEDSAKNVIAMVRTYQSFDKEKKELAGYLLSKLFDTRASQRKDTAKEGISGQGEGVPAVAAGRVPVKKAKSKARIHVELRIRFFSASHS